MLTLDLTNAPQWCDLTGADRSADRHRERQHEHLSVGQTLRLRRAVLDAGHYQARRRDRHRRPERHAPSFRLVGFHRNRPRHFRHHPGRGRHHYRSLVVAWFGNDLRAGNCSIKPGVEVATKATSPKTWTVNGVARAAAHLVSRDTEDRPVYGGTPADFAVVQAIREMKARGLRVTFYPFLLMDVPPGNTLPNPYSANAATLGQPAFPWRGRITCSPAAGYAGTADKTAAAATQVSNFFGAATPAQFAVSGDNVNWTGPAGDWGLRRMILHYAHLCAVAGGVDAFLIGTEMRGLTTIRSGASAYPAVPAFRSRFPGRYGCVLISAAASWHS